MEDFSIRAIVIGVSLFVTILTLSAILMYFNTARNIADEVNKRVDIASSFDSIVNGDNFEDTLTGVEIRSLINKYANVKHVRINFESKSNSWYDLNNHILAGWVVETKTGERIISEEKLNSIDPAKNYKVEKSEHSNIITITISEKVEK